MNKPYSESCDQNREPIGEQLARYVGDCKTVLEVGSGTGQHAVYFAAQYPHLSWQTSDLAENHSGINRWIDDSGLDNILRPLRLDARGDWPDVHYDLVFTANSLHIMSEVCAEHFMRKAPNCMHGDSVLMIYGPFNYNGRYTCASNERFDGWLKQRDPRSGIKHFEWLNAIAAESGLQCVEDVAMPANNRILVFKKSG
jgi:SAM-dependent methyltransferase